MAEVPIPFPIGGLNDSFAHGDQPPLTTRDAENVRSVDPTTNRVRGAQRAGSSLFCPERIGAGVKVQALAQVTYDARATTYSHKTTSGAGDMTEWTLRLSNGSDCAGMVHDAQGNLYALNGPATLSKVNADGVLLWDFSFPVQDGEAVIRALALDQLTGFLYVGVSEGANQEGAWLRCYRPHAEKKLERVWEVRPGGFTEWIVLSDDKLYAAQNFPDGARARFAVYENIASPQKPDLAYVKVDVPYPIHDLDVKGNGDVFTASAPVDGVRFTDPRTPDHSAILDDQRWNPTMLPEWDARKWTWFSAEDVKNVANDKELDEWRDTRGRGICRFIRDGSKGKFKTPRWKAHGLAYKPTVQFDGDWFRYITDPSAGNTEALNDVQPTLLPGRGRGYLMVIVFQGVEDTSKTGRIFQQANSNSGGVRELYINTGANATGTLAGGISPIVARKTMAAGSTNPLTVTGQFTNKNNAAIVSILCNNDVCGAGFQNGCFRVNGVPVAQFDTDDFWTNAGNRTIFGCKDDGTLGPVMGVSEIFVLQSYDDPDDGLHKVCTFPQVDATQSAGTWDPTTTDTELERIEGYFAWKYGISHLLDDGSGTTPSWDAEGGHSAYEHPFTSSLTAAGDSTLQPPNPGGRGSDAWDLALLASAGITAKWSAQRGNVRWAYQDAGMGYAVKVGSDTTIYTAGPRTNSATSGDNSAAVRALNDLGSTASYRWRYSYEDSGGLAVDYSYEFPRMVVDTFGNLWVPFNATDAGTKYSVLGFRPNGGGTPFLSYAVNGPSAVPGLAVSVDPRLPDYSTNPTTITRPEFLGLGTGNDGNASTATAYKLRTVARANNNASPRAFQRVAVAGGDIKTFDGNGNVQMVGAGALDANARWLGSVVAFNKVFFSDGVSYCYYDPKSGTVEDWTATDGGAMLPGYRLLCLWRGRMVLARGPDAPQNWQMSEYGDPFGWDLFPPDGPLATQAVNGQEHEAGQVPDSINTLIPYDRERLVFGCDHTIYCLWGDPMENGSIVLLSDMTGMAFGAPTARDSDDNLYFFGSRGGIFRMAAGSLAIRKISSETIDRRLRDVDLASYHVRLVWDDDLQELRIYQTPQGEADGIVPSWAWCKRTDSWWQDRASVEEVQPSCVAVFDGDAEDDRVCVYGTVDGWIHKVDRAAKGDRGYTIASYAVMGPYQLAYSETRLRNPKVTLASELDGARLEMLASQTADRPGSSLVSADLMPGQNARVLRGVRGACAWLKVGNAAAGQSWAWENGSVEAYGAGRKVARA